jgi:hypothetical protein
MTAATEIPVEEPVALANRSTSPMRDMVDNSLIFRRYLAEREEVLRYKWIESERVGFDIGYEQEWMSWVLRHRNNWRRAWQSCGP